MPLEKFFNLTYQKFVVSEHRDNVNIVDDNQEPYLYVGDSWFGSVKSTAQVR